MGKILYSPVLAIIYGVLLWLVVFITSVAIYPLKGYSVPLFDSLMPVAIAFFTLWLLNLYFKNVPAGYFQAGLIVGLLWMVISILIDLPLFSYGPMARSFQDYMFDIGLTYLMIPIITAGSGYLIDRRAGKA